MLLFTLGSNINRKGNSNVHHLLTGDEVKKAKPHSLSLTQTLSLLLAHSIWSVKDSISISVQCNVYLHAS